MFYRFNFIVAAFAFSVPLTIAEPVPGELFREYHFSDSQAGAGGAIRVGGKKGVSYPGRGSDFDYVNAWLAVPYEVDLEGAIRAEVVTEKILSHNGTHGLAIQWNAGDWISLPSPELIPEPRRNYYHHTSITVDLPLSDLVEEAGANRFRLKVDPEQSWGWPQHLVYGVHLRVYYDPSEKRHVAGTVSSEAGKTIAGEQAVFNVEIPDRWRRINRVDFVGHYEGVNWAGDGLYRRWHYFYYHGDLTHHLGASFNAPFRLQWDTSWIPDQSEPMQVAARITDDTGLTYFTPAVGGLQLKRNGVSVELCKPSKVPDNWVTRNGEHEQKISIKGDLTKATDARMLWSSWSPGYMNGLFVNDELVLQSEGPQYRYYDHDVALENLAILQPGENTIKTGKTPLYDGKMVHGMEVNWPGIQLLIRYGNAGGE